MVRNLQSLFAREFGGEPAIFRSPGRVNLIGEHTDYNEGFVLPAAVDRAIIIALAPRADDRCRFVAADLNQRHETTLGTLERTPKEWPNYLMGVVDQLKKAGHALRGFDCVFGGNVPIGAGMSSSAAIEGGLAFALNEVFELGVEPMTLVKLAQRAENEFVGVRCGIMDQFINIYGKKDRVVRLDCRSLEHLYVPFERNDVHIVLCDTRVRRELASSEYNMRRQQCEAGVRLLQKHFSGVRSLRDVTLAMLQSHSAEFDPVIYRRCVYVVSENDRVLAACSDLTQNDFRAFGERMYASHRGLRDDYQVSCRELDLLVEIAAGCPGVFGGRMMGAGFGGCTINLVEERAVESFVSTIERGYRARTGKEAAIHVCTIQGGTERLVPESIVIN